MAADTRTRTALKPESMLAFAEYVRSASISSSESSRELAEKFELPEDLVRESLRALRVSKPRSQEPRSRSTVSIWISSAIRWVGRFFGEHPIWSALIAGGLITTLEVATPNSQSVASIISGVLLAVAMFFVLVVINFVRGQARYALLTSVAFVFAGLGTNQVIELASGHAKGWLSMLLEVVLGTLFLGSTLGIVMCVAALGGAYYRVRRESNEELRLDRLKLLERIFDLQEQLAQEQSEARERPGRNWIMALRERWVLTAAISGAAVGSLTALFSVLTTMSAGNIEVTVLRIVVGILGTLLNAVYPAVGFISGGFLRGLAAGAIMIACVTVLTFLPLPGIGFGAWITTVRSNPTLIVVANSLLMILAAFGGLGAAVEERASHKRRLAAADSAAILSEIIRLQQLLHTGAVDVCVMVVDCVKSTAMKSGANPFVVELSFRAFHEFLEENVRRFGGSVFATTGDGLVAKFDSVTAAYGAARQIQSEMPKFNAESNRLETPFRVRIGIHSGEVHAELDQVMFSSVIDIAAHIEKCAPAGGIVVTDVARQRLGEEPFAQLAEPVDGHMIHVSLSPAD
jgi:class 3 adenylate cyclase